MVSRLSNQFLPMSIGDGSHRIQKSGSISEVRTGKVPRNIFVGGSTAPMVLQPTAKCCAGFDNVAALFVVKDATDFVSMLM